MITGRALQEYPGRGPDGDVRAYDVRTGAAGLALPLVPRPGELGHDTWEERRLEGPAAGSNVWSMMSVDPERGLVFLPIGGAGHDFYGGDRKGQNLFGNARSSPSTPRPAGGAGTSRWSTTTCGTTTSPPSRCSCHDAARRRGNPRGGPGHQDGIRLRPRPPDRRASLPGRGEAGAEERGARRVPTWPTQPFPTKPAPLSRLGIRRDELSHGHSGVASHLRGALRLRHQREHLHSARSHAHASSSRVSTAAATGAGEPWTRGPTCSTSGPTRWPRSSG